MVDGRGVLCLFRRHVVRRAKGRTRLRHALVFLIHTLGQPEVGDLDASPGTEDDVFGLDVAVDDRLFYRIAQSLCDGFDNL